MRSINIFNTPLSRPKTVVITSRWFVVLLCFLFAVPNLHSQTAKKIDPNQKQAENQLQHAQKALRKEQFSEAEADYRKAISLDNKNTTAPYNLGTAYYDKNKNDEAMFRFKQAVKTAKTKEEKHRAFHNLGNTFMNAKDYAPAVDAYKNALRNDPTDEQTRYNLALAKELLEKNPPPPDENENDDENDDNQDQDQDQDNDEDQDQDQDSNDDNDPSDEDEDDADENEGDTDKDQDGQPDDQESQQPPTGNLSPQQIESLLEAMENEEKKVQEKMNAEKQKGTKVESDKYW